MKGTELDYANNLKKAFQSVHIFISSDTEEDVEIIKNTFERWRDSQRYRIKLSDFGTVLAGKLYRRTEQRRKRRQPFGVVISFMSGV